MITINLKSTLIYLVFIALIVLIVFLIVLTKNLIGTIKRTNKVLDDASVITDIAADKAVGIDGAIADLQDAVSDVANAVKGEQSIIGAVSNIVKAIGSLVSIIKNESEKEEKEGKTRRK